MEFSEKLKILRTEANLTQEELSSKLLISRQAISNYEQGRGYPSIDILVGMSKLLNSSLDELLSSGATKKGIPQFFTLIGLLLFSGLVNILSVFYTATYARDNTATFSMILTIAVYFIPSMCFVVYLLFQCHPPKNINKYYGYRSKKSMKNQLTWDYAQVYLGVIFGKVATILFITTIIYIAITPFINLSLGLVMLFVLLAIQLCGILLPIIFVETKLAKLFKI